MPVPAEHLPTWRQLVRLEPRLADLEDDARSIEAGPRFCANTVWVRSFKPRLARLVGWARRKDELPKLVPPGDKDYVQLSWYMESPEAQRHEQMHERIRRQEAHAGLGVLWTSEVYDLAYQHVYGLLPDCSDRCPCLPRGSLQRWLGWSSHGR